MQSFIKKWVTRTHTFLLEHPKQVYQVFIGVAALAVIVQFSTIASLLYSKSDSRAVVASNDDDSAAGIGNAEKTYLLNDNGTRLYGPVYYRVSSILRNFGINQYAQGYSTQEHQERSIYFHLMLVNLLAVYLSGFFLMQLLTDRLDFQLLGTWALTGAFLANEMRSNLLYMGKPDHLVTAFVTLAMVCTWKWLKSPQGTELQKSARQWLAFTWALAMSTKLSTLFFMPGILLLFFSKSPKIWFQRAKPFLIGIVLFYFLIGFPQNFDFWRSVDYLIHQNKQTSLVNFEFLKDQWVRLFALDFQLPLVVLVLLILLLADNLKEKGTSSKRILEISLPFLLGTLWLASKEIRAPFQWYTFPFTNAGLVVFCIGCLKLVSLLPLAWNQKMNSIRQNVYYPVFAFLALPFFIQPLPLQVWKSSAMNSTCRQEAREFEVVVNERAQQNHILLVDPYVPYSREFHDKRIFMSYDMTPDIIQKLHADTIALKSSYYQIYLPKSEGGQEIPTTHIQDLEKTRQFYRIFFRKTEGVDPFGQKWKRVYADSCSFELWEKSL